MLLHTAHQTFVVDEVKSFKMRLSLLPMTLPLLLLLLSLITTVTTIKECEEAMPEFEDLPKAMKGIGNLGFDLLRKFRKNRNLMISPYTLWRTLSYAAVGAEGKTLEEILNILGLSTKRGIINISDKLKLKYSSKNITIADATRIYLMKQYEIKRCKRELSQITNHVDFTNPEVAYKTINSFVKRATRGQIPMVLNPSNIGDNTRMLLVDVLYLKGFWKYKFNKDMTSKKLFHPFDKSEKWPFMMSNRALSAKSGKVGSLKARVIQLPYAGDFVFMTIVFPEVEGKDAFKTTLRKLNHQSFMNASREIRPSTINLHLPKFEFESTYTNNMIREFKKMGMREAFDYTADFSSFKAGLYIDQAIHKTKIEVNEEGGNSSSSSIRELNLAKPGREERQITLKIKLNRPFIFVVHTKDIILLTGAYLRPKE